MRLRWRSSCSADISRIAWFNLSWLWFGGRADGRGPGSSCPYSLVHPCANGWFINGARAKNGPPPLLGSGPCVPGPGPSAPPACACALLLAGASSMGVRHTGHVLCSLSHRTTHSWWNQCLHGRKVATSPILTSSMQMEQSVLPSFRRSASTVRRSSLESPSSVAGGAAFDCGWASIKLVIMRSNAS